MSRVVLGKAEQARFVATLVLITGAPAWGATCQIFINDARSGSRIEFSHTFQEIDKTKRKLFFDGRYHFPLNDKYRCQLFYPDPGFGTMLSCESSTYPQGSVLAGMAAHFVQSDRTMVRESNPNNTLTFRLEGGFYTIKTACKDL